MITQRKKHLQRRSMDAPGIDRAIDALVRPELRYLSKEHWTPVDIAVRAVSLLCPRPDTRVLDIGAGVGKLCMVGALSKRGIWCGIEQEAPLVCEAMQLARRLRIERRTMFLHGDAFDFDWRDFDAIYLYNPFGPADAADRHRARAQATRTRERLAMLRPGTRVVTLNGFGDEVPPGYELVYHERLPIHDLDLVLWVRAAEPDAAALA